MFERLTQVNPEPDRADDIPRISIDAKATVDIGPFSRRGRSRTGTKAAVHDLKPEVTWRCTGTVRCWTRSVPPWVSPGGTISEGADRSGPLQR
jgi:hypothetical protein